MLREPKRDVRMSTTVTEVATCKANASTFVHLSGLELTIITGVPSLNGLVF